MKKITKAQAKAFAQVVKAIERAKEKGLCFFGKQYSLVAYDKQTAVYEDRHGLLERRGCNGNNMLEHLIAHGLLHDSGADDYARYITNKDDPYKGEFQETPSYQDYL